MNSIYDEFIIKNIYLYFNNKKMSDNNINDIIDVYLKMVDFCNENGLDIINFSSVELFTHIELYSILENKENDDGFEYHCENEIE